MGKPFSDLEKRALAILAGGGDPTQSLDEAVANYWKWKINPSDSSHELDDASIRSSGRKLDDFAINPFGLNMAASTFARVTVSKRAQNWIDGGLKSTLSIQDISDSTTAYRLARFTPAKVYARTGAADTPIDRTSRITKQKYKSYYARGDQGYTAPIGQNTEGDTVEQRQSAVRQAILTQDNTINLITFSPEKVG